MTLHEHADKLISELARWNDGAGIDLRSWIGTVGRFDHAVGFAAVFWPDFTVHDECLLLQPLNVENYNHWMTETKGDRTAVESVMNHRHIADLFGGSDPQTTPEVLAHLGRVMRDMWSCKLARDFPGRRVTVELAGGDSEDLMEHVITFSQDREGIGR